MKVIDIQRGYIKVRCHDRTATIAGEALLPGFGSPSFVANLNSLVAWDPPFESQLLDEDMKRKIIGCIISDFKSKDMIIEFQ
ncbi:MAG TPA: Imm74 family immunity protein [Microvirga sp.]|nr:Imm74 family immunity protein [Microvirga sp.]